MTTLGKVLAILNLVLTGFVAWFIMMSYVARTNWHAAAEKATKELTVAGQDANAYQQEKVDEQKKAEDFKAKLTTAQTDLAQEKKDRTQDVAAWKDKVNQQVAVNGKLQASLDSSTAEIRRRDEDLGNLKAELGKREKQLADMEKKVEDFRAEATEQKIAAQAEHGRNDRLLQETERLTKRVQDLERRGAGGTGVASRSNPPPEDITGVVKATDPQSGYVTLSIGSDAGLSRGNTLEVYRLRPEPAYLGTVEILAVRPNEAVAKPITRGRSPIQVGDQVASNITGGRH